MLQKNDDRKIRIEHVEIHKKYRAYARLAQVGGGIFMLLSLYNCAPFLGSTFRQGFEQFLVGGIIFLIGLGVEWAFRDSEGGSISIDMIAAFLSKFFH